MKKFMLSLLVMFTLIGCIGSTSHAQLIDDGFCDKISVTGITDDTVYVDWSVMDSDLRSKGYYNISYDVYLHDMPIYEKITQTYAQLSGLDANGMNIVYVFAYYTEPDGNLNNDFEVEFVLPVEWGGSTGANDTTTPTPSNPSEPTTPEPSYPSEPTTPEPTYPSEPTPSYPSEPTPSTPSEPTPSTPATTITVSKPSVDKVEIADGKVYVKAKNIDANADRIEWEIYDKKTGKLVKSATSYNVDATIYGVNGRKVYYARCRVIAKDSYYNDVPSEWSGKKYFVTQPKITSTRKDVKVSSINIKWKKVTGAKNYTVYAKKEKSKKWVKVKTTSKTSYKLTKIKGKKVNLRSSDYNFRVITNAKVNGKTIKSSNKEYCEAYVY